ncbi:MAG: hypothetical protein AAFZ15_29405 [Bacteroidota bacterium]
MKKIYFLLLVAALAQSCISQKSVFVLGPAQSMSITGLGAGQDAAYNPYSDENSLGVVDNIGKNSFVIRVQQEGEIVKRILIDPDERKEIQLLKGSKLYLDSELPGKAKVKFEAIP